MAWLVLEGSRAGNLRFEPPLIPFVEEETEDW